MLVRNLLREQKGIKLNANEGIVVGDRGDDFQNGADRAYKTLITILEDNKITGIYAIPKKYEVSCYFDGKKFFGANKSYKKLASRRIDLTVHKGQLMGPRAI